MSDHVARILKQWTIHRPDLDCSPMGVIGRVERMSKFLGPSLTSVFNDLDLSRIEFDILATLRRADHALTPTELYQDTMLSSGAMSTRLDHLEKKGWLERSPSATDRRSCQVSLTPSGKAKIDHALNLHVENEHKLLSALSPAEQQTLATLLGKWLAHHEDR